MFMNETKLSSNNKHYFTDKSINIQYPKIQYTKFDPITMNKLN